MYVPNFLIVMYVPFSVFCVLFVCKCVLYYCHLVSTQLQLNIHTISYLLCFRISIYVYRLKYSVIWYCVVGTERPDLTKYPTLSPSVKAA
jgi:hypothetical protein